jgi:hypothetical protein
MAQDRPSLVRDNRTEWDKAWDAISRLGAARKLLEREVPTADAEATAQDVSSPPRSVGTPTLHRSLAVWILIGALWISIGMIVSAAIVTVAYLA